MPSPHPRQPLFSLLIVLAGFVAAAAALSAQTGSGQAPTNQRDTETFRGLQFRSIGPSLLPGRVADLEVDPNDPKVWYLAMGSGGVWKTVNRGDTWTPIFDEYPSYSIGAVVVDPRNSNVVWLGTGENTHNRSTSYGDGVYKSADAGATWTAVGLRDSQKIQRILIDPRNSNVVYVATAGPLWNSGGDRGLYKTTDGGVTWSRVLHVSEDTGITDAVFHPANPDILYAAAYQRRRNNAMTIGGGPEAGIFKSTDAGATWARIESGIRDGDKGRIALGVDPRHPERVYALVVARENEGGFYLSENGGRAWQRMSSYAGGDPQYYGEIFVDPHRPDTIWNIEVSVMRSTDKGATWERMPFQMHVDHHEVVFDPADPKHMWIGNDGGLYETFDTGKTWRHFTNLPLMQFYRVSADNSRPFYRTCGGSQDNGTVCGPSRTLNAVGVRTSEWFVVGGGDGFQAYIDPHLSNIVYAQSQNGALTRLDLTTGESVGIRPTRAIPRGGNQDQGRWHWDSPLLVSPHAAGRIYYAGHRLYRSDDRGDAWTPVSGDLTRNLDRREMAIMGKVWPADAIGLHLFTTTMSTITALDESPVLEGLLYVGTDDGLIQVSEDGGGAWRRIEQFPALPRWSYVTDVFASPRNADVVFATFNNWQNGDFRPWVLRSDDRGRTWTNITGNLPARSGAWSVVQDHANPNLLFVGLEFGVWFSVNGGGQWTELRGGFPRIQARDLHIQRQWTDLVVGTFGRGTYILDDYTALRSLTPESLAADGWLFPLRQVPLFNELEQVLEVWGDQAFPNPPFGATLTYHLRAPVAAGSQLVLTITNDAGEQVRRLTLPNDTGVRRVTWDLRRDSGAQNRPGPRVSTGRYTATLGRMTGTEVTPLGAPQHVHVVPLQR
ncbi:MAG: glycosyl hydrolase [Acidimicrobiia bacterium]|nr:glycosyl hydrolase [Acidimicrobiia bacterium]